MKLIVAFRNFSNATKNVSYKNTTEMGNRLNQYQTADTSVRPDSCTFPKMGRTVTVSVSYFTYFCAVIWAGTNKVFHLKLDGSQSTKKTGNAEKNLRLDGIKLQDYLGSVTLTA
jgi:hypothetical protein